MRPELGTVPLAKAATIALSIAVAAVGCGGSEADDRRRVPGGDPDRGKALLSTFGCAGCHEIPGVVGRHLLVGPPLSGFARRTIIAGRLPNEPEHLVLWIASPREVKPGTAMPDLQVQEAEARDMAAYLYGLQ